MEKMMTTGILLGAGASFECGMPLVWELTKEIKDILTPKMLRDRNRRSQSLNLGHPEAIIEYQISLLESPIMHYENIIGNLQLTAKRIENRVQNQTYHGLASDLTEFVYWMLYDRHKAFQFMLLHHMRFLQGIHDLAIANQPLWIFSLNHDLLIECLAAHYNIPLSTGFSALKLLPLPKNNESQDFLRTSVLTGKDLELGLLSFFQQEFGINLFKLHGSLDVFQFNDAGDFLKLDPKAKSAEDILNTLYLVNEKLQYVDPRAPLIRPTNEIMYLDEKGELQFLRRSLLAGAFKFPNISVKSHDLRSLFRLNIGHLNKLIIVGYGFGDNHVNDGIRNWAETSSKNLIEIVDPIRTEIPMDFLHMAPQISLIKMTAFQYFDSISSKPLPKSERQFRDQMLLARNIPISNLNLIRRRKFGPSPS